MMTKADDDDKARFMEFFDTLFSKYEIWTIQGTKTKRLPLHFGETSLGCYLDLKEHFIEEIELIHLTSRLVQYFI